MSGFAVPYSSSSPSTPDSRLRTPNGFLKNAGSSNFDLSTTPAGPPPSSAPSFTPSGPPPHSSLFGSSQPSHRNQAKPMFNSEESLFSSPTTAPPLDEGLSEENDREGYGESWMGSMDDSMELGDAINGIMNYSSPQMSQSAPRGVKRTRGGAPKKASPIPTIAKDMATQMGVSQISESNDFILETEASLRQLHAAVVDEQSEVDIEASIPTAVEGLCETWRLSRIRERKEIHSEDSEEDGEAEEEEAVRILPDESEPHWYKASFLATLLLRLHYPPAAKGMHALAVSRTSRRDPFSTTLNRPPSTKKYKTTPHPKVLLDWLDRNHWQLNDILQDIYTCNPNPTADRRYWDMILSLTIRGQIAEVIHMFKKSDFQYAQTAREDGHGKTGYEGMMLKNIDRVVKRAVQSLEMCPALQDGGDWDIVGSDWALFRKRVEQAKADLKVFAEGHDRDAEPDVSTFEAPNFGLKVPDKKITQSVRKAESQVPWSVYQELQTLYGVLSGATTEILSSSQDWMEATIGLTAWWDGEEDDEVSVGSLAMTRRSLRKTQTRGSRLIDINPTEAYLRRLSYSFQKITDNEDEGLFQISSISPVEVGLASIFEGNVEGAIGLLRAWSLPVASAVVEVASLGGWYNPGPSSGMMEGFDESDLLVLSSFGNREMVISRDSIMVDYAEKLAKIDLLGDAKEETTLEGWELSTQIFSRLQDKSEARKKLLNLIRDLRLISERRVDRLTRICNSFGMETEGHEIAERYADDIAENTEHYGKALMYYARAHSRKKVKNVFDLLISLSLVQSTAFAPSSTQDESLNQLVSDPERTLGLVAFHDEEAASILHFYLTGYAALRKFYHLRDVDFDLKEGEKPRLRPLARRRAAATTLIALITSASDGIHGGLYDESRDSVVHVDGLLALLGEAMVFVNQPQPILTQNQNIALLSAIESLETVSKSVYMRCEDCLASTLSAYHDSQSPPDSRDMMRKTISSSSSSGFSLIGSEMLGESMTSGGGSGSMVKVGKRRSKDKGKVVHRGWDWRKGVQRNAKGEDILRILRLGLAKDMAKAWIGSSS